MAHIHSVYDSDAHFSINPITRALRSEASGKTTLFQTDHRSERFTFAVPRMIEGHDLMLCNRVEVHYTNADATDKTKVSKDVYEVNDLRVSPESEDIVICSWLVDGKATKYAGTLRFSLKFKCVSDNGTVDYVWNTAIFTGISVSPGKDNGEAVVEEYSDILEQWRRKIVSAVENGLNPVAVSHSVEGELYFAHGEGLPAVSSGEVRRILFIPDIANSISEPTLSINNGEHFPISMRTSQDQDGEQSQYTAVPVGMLKAGIPYMLTFTGDCWLVDSMIDTPSDIAPDADPDNEQLSGFADALTGFSDSDLCGIPIIENLSDSGEYGVMNIQRTSEEEENPGFVEVPSVGMMTEAIKNAGGGTGGNVTLTVRAIADSEVFVAEGGDPEIGVDTCIIITNLVNASIDNPAAMVEKGSAYVATITPNDGCSFSEVQVTMNNVNITNIAYADGVITISSVIGNVVITATATDKVSIPTDGLLAFYDMSARGSNDNIIYDQSGNGNNIVLDPDRTKGVYQDGYISYNGEGILAAESCFNVNVSADVAMVIFAISNHSTNGTSSALINLRDIVPVSRYKTGVILYKSAFYSTYTDNALKFKGVETIGVAIDGTSEKIYINGVLTMTMTEGLPSNLNGIGLLTGWENGGDKMTRIHSVAVYDHILSDLDVATISATLATMAEGVE